MITILSPVNVREDTTTTSWTLNLSGPGLNAPSASSARGIPTKRLAVTGQWTPKLTLCQYLEVASLTGSATPAS